MQAFERLRILVDLGQQHNAQACPFAKFLIQKYSTVYAACDAVKEYKMVLGSLLSFFRG